ncbi:MAG: FIST C-terminal domain-containing protein [Myxococcota bacterium]
MPSAASFEVLANHPGEVAACLERAIAPLGDKLGGGLIFLSGTLARQILDVAVRIKGLRCSAPVLIATGAGVLTERGEHEQISGCAGVVWPGAGCATFALDQRSDEPLSQRLADAVERISGPRHHPVALFASREVLNPRELFDMARPLALPLFGGGSVGKPGAVVVSDGRVLTGDVAGMALQGVGRAIVRASPACEVLGKPQPVTSRDGALVLSIASRPALDVLRSQAAETAGQRPVVVAVEISDTDASRSRVMLRGIRGIHEGRGGVMVSEDVVEGTRIAFAVLDGAAAAADFETTLREASRDVCGGVPRFGVYIDCAGRGSQLYGESGLDVQAIRRQFPKLPIAGVKSAFEVGPGLSGATTHLYSGVFALIYAPS